MKIFVQGTNIEKALRILKKKTAGMLKEYKERRKFKKPSQIRHERNQSIIRKRERARNEKKKSNSYYKR